MSMTLFPNGVSSFGMPVLPFAPVPSMVSLGNTWFVDSAGPAGQGFDPSGNYSTLAGAVAAASAGDCIICDETHAETISSNTALTMSKAGIKVIGIGSGQRRPTFTLDTAATTTINVTAASVLFQNCRFIANYADIAACFTTTAAKNLTLVDCEVLDTDATHNFLAIVKTSTTDNAADGLSLVRVRQNGAGLTANTAVLDLRANLDKLGIQSCRIQSLVAGNSALIYQATTTKVLTDVNIDDNQLNFVGANAATGVLLVTTATTHSGNVSRNRVWGARVVASALLVTASSGLKFWENYYQTAADKSGILLPANV